MRSCPDQAEKPQVDNSQHPLFALGFKLVGKGVQVSAARQLNNDPVCSAVAVAVGATASPGVARRTISPGALVATGNGVMASTSANVFVGTITPMAVREGIEVARI